MGMKVFKRTPVKPKQRINLRQLYSDVTKEEGGKVSMSVAQVSEAGDILLTKLAEVYQDDPAAVIELLERKLQ